ncbi:unnamed protein product [Macrosiphum euphorbiae]|uniref:LAGLIDADG homing endonuclease n=1 Tax=Macrosiphum euphorbiae TaxID=13131 RepID=A0AAV0WQK1_9HEMI|nr:unnamed protein product [Macrosiphum euphorbiae]
MKTADGNWINNEVLKFQSKYSVKQVFTQTQELLLFEYMVKCSKINYGLTTKQIRKLAHDYAIGCNIEVPPSWNLFLISGIDWFSGFMPRHLDLAIRKPVVDFDHQNYVVSFLKKKKQVAHLFTMIKTI